MQITVDGAENLAVGQCRLFEFPRNGRPAQGFVIRYHDGYHAYLNQCCHWHVPLDLGDGDFYYADIDRITCKTHGATYVPDTGFCDFGPCAGGVLTAYPVVLDEKGVTVTVPD